MKYKHVIEERRKGKDVKNKWMERRRNERKMVKGEESFVR